MVEKQCKIAKDASYVLAYTDTADKNAMLASIADALLKNADYILKENAKDLKNPMVSTMTAGQYLSQVQAGRSGM